MRRVDSDSHCDRDLLSALLLGMLLIKIAVSAGYLTSGTWIWPGPGISEAATHDEALPPSPASLPRLFSLIQKERQSLLAREAAVAAKEDHLRTLQKEVEERLQELKALQLKVLEAVEEEKRIKSEHNRHLVGTLTAMPPDRAARLLEKMEEEVAVQLFRSISGKEAGAILAALPPEKAARLSQRLLQ
jgi:flagellar motility protein MotE (MotC chaperone)